MNIHISETDPSRSLAMLELAARTDSRHYIWSVPDDIEAVFIALKRGDCHFRVDAHLVPSGVWVADIEPGHVPEVIESRYEVYGCRNGNNTYLGHGKFSVKESCSSGEKIEGLQAATRIPLYDDQGLIHTLKIVQLETGDYTLQID